MDEDNRIIVAQNVFKEFGSTTAVRELSFSVPEGAIFGFIGPSGSGKTTMIRILTGYYQPSSGEVYVFGKKPQSFSRSDRAKIGYLPQRFSLYPNLTVWENLQFAASIYGMPILRKKRLLEILDLVELTNDKNKLAKQLSGGMQRRLNLGATLVHNPHLIFLDEPTAGVDPVLRRKFWDYFRFLQNEGNTLFITTQYVTEAAYCDLVGLIDKGKMIIMDSPAQLRYQAYGGDLVTFRTVHPLELEILQEIAHLPFIISVPERQDNFSAHLLVQEANRDIASLLDWAKDHGLEIEAIEETLPPFDDVFVELVKKEGNYA